MGLRCRQRRPDVDLTAERLGVIVRAAEFQGVLQQVAQFPVLVDPTCQAGRDFQRYIAKLLLCEANPILDIVPKRGCRMGVVLVKPLTLSNRATPERSY